MTHRTLLLLASATALVTAAPAAGQDQPTHGEAMHHGEREHHGTPERHSGRYDGEWEGEWAEPDVWHGEWTGAYTDPHGESIEADYRGTWRSGHGDHRRHHGPRLAYSPAERAQWLADCRFLMAGSSGYGDDRRESAGNGGVIGGVLGAVIGGVAGNRIADDDRVLGTVVGAGIGGLAGAAIGSALDSNGDGEVTRDELWVAQYCDAYLRRYELGAGTWGQAQPVMVVPLGYATPRRRHRQSACLDCERIEIVADVIAVEEPAPGPAPAPVPEPQGKVTPIG